MIPGMQRRDDSTVRNIRGGWYPLVLAATHRPHAIIMIALSTLLSFSISPRIPMSAFASIYLLSFKMCERLIFLINTEAEAKFYRRLNDERNPGLAARIDKLHRDGKRVVFEIGK